MANKSWELAPVAQYRHSQDCFVVGLPNGAPMCLVGTAVNIWEIVTSFSGAFELEQVLTQVQQLFDVDLDEISDSVAEFIEQLEVAEIVRPV